MIGWGRETSGSFLAPLADYLADYGIGAIAEIFDGDLRFAPGGVHRAGLERRRDAPGVARPVSRLTPVAPTFHTVVTSGSNRPPDNPCP
jgi:hypothetical protein